VVKILVLCLIQKNINNSTLFSYHHAGVTASDVIQHRLEESGTAKCLDFPELSPTAGQQEIQHHSQDNKILFVFKNMQFPVDSILYCHTCCLVLFFLSHIPSLIESSWYCTEETSGLGRLLLHACRASDTGYKP